MLDFDFTLLENEDFKEDSVREFIIAPLLAKLGFEIKNDKTPQKLEMILSKSKKAEFKIGSNKKLEANLTPDYLLYKNQKIYCILDAKAPNENIQKDSGAYKQAQSYAIAFECEYFSLCNGWQLSIFALSGKIILDIDLKNELEAKFKDLLAFFEGESVTIKSLQNKKPDSWYLSREIPKPILKPQKRKKARHYGCTAYFTRQSWDIVTQNIKNFTNEGDVVLDTFGGSGVSAIEAMMNNRIGIHTDLNPLSIFMVKALAAQVNLSNFYDISEEILAEFEHLKPKNEKEAKAILKKAKHYPNAIDCEFGKIATQKTQDEFLWIPKDEILPKGSDVDSVLGLFSSLQLVELAILRKLIFKHTAPSGSKEYRIKQRNMRYSLLLAFYNTINDINLTYHKSDTGGGDSAIFRYYRYRIAKEATLKNTQETFKQKIQRVLKGKRELENSPYFYQSYYEPLQRVIKDFQGSMLKERDLENIGSIIDKTNGEKIFQADATNLAEIESGSVDFIYTDPPYGAKIPYLDLSTMWNAWLDLSVDKEIREKECIEKGSLEKSRDDYYDLMKASLQEMYRVLKFNRWLCFVFQHQDPRLWQTLVECAEKLGFEYIGSVRQSNGQVSFKKVQNPFSVLSGQLLMYFKKVDNPKARIKEDLLGDTFDLVLNHIEALIAKDDGASLEEIYAELTIKGLELGFLPELSRNYEDLTALINGNFDFDEKTQKYHIKKGQKFKSYKIDIKVRTRYFLLSYLRGCERQNKKAYFDDICLEIIPLLKNGVSPDENLIKEVLEQIALPNTKTGEWILKTKERTLFD